MNVSVMWFVFLVCCHEGDFNCSVEIKGRENDYKLILNKETLSKQDIVLMTVDLEFDCMPHTFYNTTSGMTTSLLCEFLKKETRLGQSD